MAIFIVEDDAQNGVDHVDGHRTVALVVSPYTRRGMWTRRLRAPEHSEDDRADAGPAGADPVRPDRHGHAGQFHHNAGLHALRGVTPAQDLFEVNPPAKALKGEARRRAAVGADELGPPDARTQRPLNRILWHNIKG